MDNDDKDTPLIRAAWRGHNEVVRTLVKTELNLNVRNDEGETALIKAVCDDHSEVVSTLIKANADLDITDNDGVTALNLAAQKGEIKVVFVKTEDNDADIFTKNVSADVNRKHSEKMMKLE